MSLALPRLAESLRGLKVVVVGDAMLDEYLSGSSGRLCPEAPVPVVAVSRSDEAPGGAANVAANAAGPRLLAVDAKHLVRYARAGVTVAKPNYAQAVSMLAQAPPLDRASRAPWMVEQGEQLLERCAADIVAVTLDADGALVFERGR